MIPHPCHERVKKKRGGGGDVTELHGLKWVGITFHISPCIKLLRVSFG